MLTQVDNCKFHLLIPVGAEPSLTCKCSVHALDYILDRARISFEVCVLSEGRISRGPAWVLSPIYFVTMALVGGFLYCPDRTSSPGLRKGNSMDHHAEM